MNYMANVVVMQHNADQALLMVLATLTSFALAGTVALAFAHLSRVLIPESLGSYTIRQQRERYNEEVRKSQETV